MTGSRGGFDRIGIRGMSDKPKVAETARTLAPWLLGKGCEVTLSGKIAKAMDRPDLADADEFRGVDLLISLGGDGTLLSSARLVAAAGTPIMGVDLGSLGFLTTVRAEDVLQAMERALAGEFNFEERMMLEVAVVRGGEPVESRLALNDAVVAKGQSRPIVRLRTFVDGELLISYPADGIIVASATGSTAYSLSAGGPIVDPALGAMILNPICPHSLLARALILDGRETVSVRPPEDRDDLTLTVDGQSRIELAAGDEVRITGAETPLRIVKLGKPGFYGSLRLKLGLGGGIGEL